MKFFIPEVDDEELAEKTYQGIVSFAKETMGWDIGSRRIFRIAYHHGGKDRVAEVGKRETPQGEVVLAILESNAYLVCTPSRGVIRGMPFLVGTKEAYNVIDFDESSA